MQQNADFCEKRIWKVKRENAADYAAANAFSCVVPCYFLSRKTRCNALEISTAAKPPVHGTREATWCETAAQHEPHLTVRGVRRHLCTQLSSSQKSHAVCDFENVSKLNEITKRLNASRRFDEEELDEIHQQLSRTMKAKRVLSCKFRRA